MAGETTLTICGNTTGPAELRFTPSGSPVATFTVASTPRTFKDGQWVDGDTLFLRCSAWRDMAENVAETLTDKGMRIIVTGRLKQRSYEKDNQKRTVIEMEVDEVGPSLRYATAKVARTQRKDNAGGNQQGGQWGGNQQGTQQGGGEWGGQAPDNGGGWGNGPDSEPPF
jgi:single-strand DNA-binding protein